MLHSVCNVALSVKFEIYVCGGDLRSFVVGQFWRKFTHFPSVKYSRLKMCACKKNDKYEVCVKGRKSYDLIFNFWPVFHLLDSLHTQIRREKKFLAQSEDVASSSSDPSKLGDQLTEIG